MPTLTATEFLSFTDDLILAAQGLVGTLGSGLGEGDNLALIGNDWGFSKACRNLEALVLSWQDYDLSNVLNTPSDQLRRAAGYQARLSTQPVQAIMRAFNVACQNTALAGVTSIDTYATYLNTGAGGPWNGLLGPDFRAVHQLGLANPLSSINAFSPAIVAAGSYNGVSTPNGVGKLVVTAGSGVFSAAQASDNTKYAGIALPQLVTSSLVFNAVSSTTITVTGNGLSATGGAVTGHTWTANVTANGTVTLTPTVAGDILQSVTGISFTATTVTTGTFIVQGNIPQAGSGYSNLAAARVTPLSTFTIAY